MVPPQLSNWRVDVGGCWSELLLLLGGGGGHKVGDSAWRVWKGVLAVAVLPMRSGGL